MGLQEDIQQIAERFNDAKEHILTEEATKTSLIIPFIQALGYDTWNPLEVVKVKCSKHAHEYAHEYPHF